MAQELNSSVFSHGTQIIENILFQNNCEVLTFFWAILKIVSVHHILFIVV